MANEPVIPPLDRVGEHLRVAMRETAVRRTRRRRGAVFALSGVAVAVVAAIGLAGRGENNRVFTVDEAVAAVARATYDQPQPRPGDVLYKKSEIFTRQGIGPGGKFLSRYPHTWLRESWSRPGDKKGWQRSTLASGRGSRSRPRSVTCHTVFAAWNSQQNELGELHLPKGTMIPSDPSAMYALLKRNVPRGYMGPGGDDYVVWTSIGFMMGRGAPNLTAPQRAAVVGALAKIPGVTTTGPTIDPAGNPAIGFALDSGNTRQRLFFDRRTSLTTYSDEAATRPVSTGPNTRPYPVGTTLSSRTLLEYRYISAYPKLDQSSYRTPNWLLDDCPELRHEAAISSRSKN